jgi:hypothetical protein
MSLRRRGTLVTYWPLRSRVETLYICYVIYTSTAHTISHWPALYMLCNESTASSTRHPPTYPMYPVFHATTLIFMKQIVVVWQKQAHRDICSVWPLRDVTLFFIVMQLIVFCSTNSSYCCMNKHRGWNFFKNVIKSFTCVLVTIPSPLYSLCVTITWRHKHLIFNQHFQF